MCEAVEDYMKMRGYDFLFEELIQLIKYSQKIVV